MLSTLVSYLLHDVVSTHDPRDVWSFFSVRVRQLQYAKFHLNIFYGVVGYEHRLWSFDNNPSTTARRLLIVFTLSHLLL